MCSCSLAVNKSATSSKWFRAIFTFITQTCWNLTTAQRTNVNAEATWWLRRWASEKFILVDRNTQCSAIVSRRLCCYCFEPLAGQLSCVISSSLETKYCFSRKGWMLVDAPNTSLTANHRWEFVREYSKAPQTWSWCLLVSNHPYIELISRNRFIYFLSRQWK